MWKIRKFALGLKVLERHVGSHVNHVVITSVYHEEYHTETMENGAARAGGNDADACGGKG